MSFGQIATPGLVFRDEDHTYWLDGKLVPSVSQVIRDNRLGADFSQVPADDLAQARALGTAVHAALHYEDEGTLDPATVDPRVQPYIDAWRQFKVERGVTVVEMERRYADHTYRVAGTLDRILVVTEGRRGVRVVGDIKTGNVEGANYQTAAYHFLADEGLSTQRWAVQLHPERAIPYTVHPYPSPRDWRLFRAALELTHERAAIGRSWLEAA